MKVMNMARLLLRHTNHSKKFKNAVLIPVIPPLQSNSILQRWSRCRRPSAIAADITYDDELPLLQSVFCGHGDVELGGIN